MWSTDRERPDPALGHLSRLAEALRRIGLTADLASDRHPFPGLAVRLSPGAATVMILAGSAHYWRQRPNGDLQLVGPLEEPTEAAGKILGRLRSGKKHPSPRAFQPASCRGVSWN